MSEPINDMDEFRDLLAGSRLQFFDHEKRWFPEEKVKCWEVEVPDLRQSWYFRKLDGSFFRVEKN